MMSQSGETFDPSTYTTKFSSQTKPGIPLGLLKNAPPPNYICYRCGQRGHWIKLCPTNGDPTFDHYRKRLMQGQMPKKGVSGGVANLQNPDLQDAKGQGKMAALQAPQKVEVPPELTCSICKELVRDAVIIPCCGESFCDECIREHLLENEFVCPACEQTDVSPDTLAPNKALRTVSPVAH